MTDPARVTSARQAARLAGVGQRTIRRWIDAGLLPGPPPWTDAQVQQAAAAGGQPTRRGTRALHGTPARYDAGCDCPDCRRANTQQKKPSPELAQVAVELQPLLDALAAGTGYAEALTTHGYSRQRITSLRRWPVVAQALDASLMAGRNPDLDHGTPGAWRAGGAAAPSAAPTTTTPARHRRSPRPLLSTREAPRTMPNSPADREQRRAQLASRDAEMCAAWVAGDSPDALARRYHLSPNRVMQILASVPGLAAQRDRHRYAHQAAQHELVLAWSQRHPGAPLAEAEAQLGIRRDQLRAILGDRAALHRAPHPDPAVVIPDEDVDEALAEFVRSGGRRRLDYDHQARERGWPSSSTVINRHGMWSLALAQHGIAPTRRRDREKHFTDDELWEWLDRYAAATPLPWTTRSAEAWLKTHPDAPSLGIIRRRLGRWSTLTPELARRAAAA